MKGSDSRSLEAPEAGLVVPAGAGSPEAASAASKWPLLLLVFGCYFLLQAISRGLISETLGMDDADQALLAQEWSWGYGPQPPLYTWLVMLLSRTMGLSSFSMAFLKNLLLLGIYLLTYFNALLITRNRIAAIVAAAALQFMPSVAYEAHRELTHSILASFMVLATLFLFLAIRQRLLGDLKRERGRLLVPALYLLLGLAGGLGILSKYNYSIFYLGLVLAAVSLRSWRGVVWNHWMVLTLAVTVLVIGPNLWWMKSHPDLAFASAGKFDLDPTHSIRSMARGVISWGSTYMDQVGLLALLFALLFWRELRGYLRRDSSTARASTVNQAGAADDGRQILGRTFLFVAGIIVLGIIVSGATNCRNRWLQPLVISTPIWMGALCAAYLAGRRLRVILWLSALIALGVAIAHPARILLTEKLGKVEGLNAPFRGLAAQLRGPLGDAPAIFCPDTAMAGNLRVWFPGKRVTSIGVSKLYPPHAPCALIWDASWARAGLFLSTNAVLTGASPAEAIYVESIWKYHHAAKMKVGLLWRSSREEQAGKP